MVYLDSLGTIDKSAHWPSINPAFFLQNLKRNIEKPLFVYGGRNTNFCGYAALTYTCLNNEPLAYARFMMELYLHGRSHYRNVQFLPSAGIKTAVGQLIFKGELDINHADQLWFLVLADHFKGYINLLNRNYNPGDENRIWASTNLAKFNRMLKKMFHYELKSVGSDLIRPSISHPTTYLQEKMKGHEVYLYLNNTVLYRKKHKIKSRIPTHYVVLTGIEEENGWVKLTYWDYGYKTLQQITPRVFKKILYGVTWCKKN